jgi:hypothetical protein
MLELYKQFTGGTAFFTNVLFNDTLNNAPVVADQVNTTFVSATNAGSLSGYQCAGCCGYTPAGNYSLVHTKSVILNQPIVIPLPLV